MYGPSHTCRLAATDIGAVTQLRVKVTFTGAADFYVMRLSFICLYSVEYYDKIIVHIEHKGAQSCHCILNKYQRNHTHTHLCVCNIL